MNSGVGHVVVVDANVTTAPVPCGDARSEPSVGTVHAGAATAKVLVAFVSYAVVPPASRSSASRT